MTVMCGDDIVEKSEKPEKNRVEGGTLYLVATPIGNRDDLSSRAVKVLTECDFVAAEDTRVSGGLLNGLGLSKSMIPYHEHNKRDKGEQILRRLKEGESCALVTDAGTPAVSDPGADIARLCIENGVPVTAVPGPCAAITALILSGFDTRRFVFEGFAGAMKKERIARFEELVNETRTVICYEAPHRLREMLADLLTVFGEKRRIALCRELTKLNEEVLRLTVGEAVEYYQTHQPRGEYVVILEGKSADDEGTFWQTMTVPDHVRFYESSGLARMDAIKAAARDRRVPKGEIYRQMIDASEQEE